jgi:hypothetical protein
MRIGSCHKNQGPTPVRTGCYFRPTSAGTRAGSAGHRSNSPTAIVRMPSTAMTPVAMLVRGHIHIRGCTLWRRCPLVIRLGHRQILRHSNCRQCADNQDAAYKSDTHARLRLLLHCQCYASTRRQIGHAKIVPTASAWTLATGAITTARPNVTPIPSTLRQSAKVAIASHQNDPNTVPRTRTAASAMMQVTITVITISK